ncbi:hypothetical protein [Microbulbifer sp. THAF38]|uniref:hypothetical protein n=1 Tax=Microbulbifer sp. THAF38 TaxID=2587856 RepID=UPI001268E796|nr:hypothetical protein [Microbulbifer sp. THAF38]QFT55299.1 hypothetical protein FIU95_12115 [Microbulbifer sp. THAF38]
MHTPNYMDSHHYMSHTPYMPLSRVKGGESFLSLKLSEITPYEKFIEYFPRIKCEPLEFLYQTHRTICAMDKYLYEDLVLHCWRSISWAAWIALVTPYPERYMLKFLKRTEGRISEQWSVKTAILRLRKRNQGNDDLIAKAKVFEGYLARLPFKKIPLRKTNIKAQLDHNIETQIKLRKIYSEGGTNAAISYLRCREPNELEISYQEWLSKQT